LRGGTRERERERQRETEREGEREREREKERESCILRTFQPPRQFGSAATDDDDDDDVQFIQNKMADKQLVLAITLLYGYVCYNCIYVMYSAWVRNVISPDIDIDDRLLHACWWSLSLSPSVSLSLSLSDIPCWRPGRDLIDTVVMGSTFLQSPT
jgi:hypothetical protein